MPRRRWMASQCSDCSCDPVVMMGSRLIGAQSGIKRVLIRHTLEDERGRPRKA
ncbi:hypothetical protein OBBRIDRAFT_287098 [Obba rivulosa]|uniref:Uncharacterized protein n=1 Tax=Obba rivulosa TaxID=1052685 RepID=A0A8E2ALV8_9APHY|nr:hypothetical protein OBBRIDRAFT_287098 [Obba rivulosa]